jgi:nicotinamide phosphoribosyltransferase
MENINAALLIDAYKSFHVHAYHPDVTHVYSNFTNRDGLYSNTKRNGVVFVGLQYFIKDILIRQWNETFFSKSKDEAISEYKRVISSMLGKDIDATHMEKLHDLGYLPIKIKALPEGSLVPYKVPVLTITNTVSGFGWVTNMLETVLSSELWGISTSATTAYAYRKRFEMEPSLKKLGMNKFLGHDFSYRGMFGSKAAAQSGFGHLCSFFGSDTIPAALFAEKYYNAKIDKELVFSSVKATEHSTMCSYGVENEIESLERLITQVVPDGIISIVSDTWDFWKLVTEYLPKLKDKILARNGTLVVRPDSGCPVKILTGYLPEDGIKPMTFTKEGIPELWMDTEGNIITDAERKGLIECLCETFGGTIQEGTGLKLLDSHIGAIYGDSITLERQDQIIQRLLKKGFVPSVVLGIGSFTYQYVTRDTHGSAVKATCVQKGEGNYEAIFKDPKTDHKKRSAKGLLKVTLTDGKYCLENDVTPSQEKEGELKTIFEDGKLLVETSLNEIRERIDATFKL